jgi:hypothetical protein
MASRVRSAPFASKATGIILAASAKRVCDGRAAAEPLPHSFYQSKILGAFGDAGAVVTNDPADARPASLYCG